MNKKLPPLNSLRVFESAARHLSFTKAAEELFVTQAAVSHQIKSLEEFIGLKLFIRRNRSLLLTDEGQSYFFDIKDVFKSVQDATNKLLERSEKGALTISLPPSFAIQWLVPRLTDFNQQQPDIDVRIKAVDKYEGSLLEDVDVAIYYGKGLWPGLRADKLYQEFLIPLCSPSLTSDSHEKPLRSLPDLQYHTLLHDESRQDWQLFAKENHLALENAGYGPIFSHSTMVLQAAALGQGIALANNVLAQPEVDAGRLVAPFDKVLMTDNAFYLVCHETLAHTGRISTFRHWMLNRARQEQEVILDEGFPAD